MPPTTNMSGAVLFAGKAAFVAPLVAYAWAAVPQLPLAVLATAATGIAALLSPGGELCGSVILALGVALSGLRLRDTADPAVLLHAVALGSCIAIFALALQLKRARQHVSKLPAAKEA